MSAIATFTLFPISLASDLRDAAGPKVLLWKSRDNFHRFLNEKGRALAEYSSSGYFFATLLPYLQQKRSISFTNSDFDGLETFISKVRDTSSFVLTHSHRERYLDQLDPTTFSESELRDYFENFNATKDPESGKALLDAITVLQRNLAEVGSDSFILLIIG